MKIGYLIGALNAGGSERQLIELSTGMAARGHVVEVAAYDGSGTFDGSAEERGVTVRRMNGGAKLDKLLAVRRWVAHFEPDVMHGFMKRASSIAVLANLPRRRCPVIASDLSTATYSRRQPILWGALVLFAWADRVATQTEMNRRSIGLLAPWLRSKTVVIRNGVNTARFMPSRPRPADDVFRFLCVGTAYRLKNPVRVVEAARILLDRGVDFIIDWVGNPGQGGSQSEDFLLASSLVQRYGLEDKFRFLGPSHHMEEVYRQYDALIHVSLQDGIPNAVVEAMASGLPVVVSRVSDLPKIVRSASNGLVCDESAPPSIADSMMRMTKIPEQERREMGEHSRDLAVEWFGLDRFVDEYEALYSSLVKGNRNGLM